MNSAIIKTAGDFVFRHTTKVRKYAPEILTVVAGVCTVGGTIMACKATTHLNDILDDSNDQLDAIHDAHDEGVTSSGEDYTEDDFKKDLVKAYIVTGVKVVKLYAPAAGVITLSLVSMFASTGIARKRNLSLAAAYAALNRAYSEYRNRVSERFGADVEKDILYNIKAEQVSETVEDNDTGKKKRVKKTIKTNDGTVYSPYAFFFDELNTKEWRDTAERNLYFLNAQQKYLNDRLHARHVVTLAEVKEALGCDECIETRDYHVGWTYKPNCPSGDNYIDFGIFDISRPAVRDFLDGYEPSIIIDPNVDGYIYDIEDR